MIINDIEYAIRFWIETEDGDISGADGSAITT